MADTQKWVTAIEQVIDASQRPGGKPIRTGMLDLVQSAYREGLRDATDLNEKRRLIAILAASKPSTDERARTIELEAAAAMVEQILTTVK